MNNEQIKTYDEYLSVGNGYVHNIGAGGVNRLGGINTDFPRLPKHQICFKRWVQMCMRAARAQGRTTCLNTEGL